MTAAALLGRTLLAATGNGSWLDVGLDLLALLTLGISGGIDGAGGLVARAGARLGEAIKVGDSIVEEGREATLSGKAISMFSKGTEAVNGIAESLSKIPGLSVLANMFGKAGDMLEGGSDFLADYQDAAYPLAKDMVEGLEEKSAALRAVRGGDIQANNVVKMNTLKEAFSDSPEFMALAGRFDSTMNAARGLILSSAGVNLGTSLGLPGFPVYTPGHFGDADPTKQVWDFELFDTVDEALTHAIPEPAQGVPGARTPHFTITHGVIGK